MYNPDFWEIRLDQAGMERFPNEAGLWFESGEERKARYLREDAAEEMGSRLMQVVSEALTDRQREAVILYFCRRKTQTDISRLLGISRRVLGQHLFGIRRDGKRVGGAVKKMRKHCAKRGIDTPVARIS
jgi:DNA-directed RNA polymerase specialized sigma24 family protein